MLRWSANLTMLFKEVVFLERLMAAARAGFQVVEFMWPIGVDLKSLVAARAASGVAVIFFNVDSGDVPAGERGFPNLPERRAWWRERTGVAIELAGRLGCSRLNVQAGNTVTGLSRQTMLDCLSENLAWALAQAPGITFFIEPLNCFEHPRYLLSRTAEAVEVIQNLQNPRLKLLLDVYHTQRTEGNLARLIETHFADIGHIQVADSPARHQPGTGEIHWPYLFALLERLGYGGTIGLEYIPTPDTLGSLAWLPSEQRAACTTADLRL